MSATEAQRTWITDVLGLSFPALSARDGSQRQESGDEAPARRQPFQIFVKGLDDVTLTLTLPNGDQTKIGDLQRLIEDRTGIAPGEQNLTTGARSFNSRHADLPVSEYELRRNQTLSLQGRLKGGFGERAAIADIILNELRRGNVVSDIEDSGGRTAAKVAFHRSLFGGLPKLKEGEVRHPAEQYLENLPSEGEALLNDIADEAVRLMDDGQEGFDSAAVKRKWLRDHKTSIESMVISRGKAANCSDYAEVVYTNILSKTTGQTVYQVSMVGKGQDHRFVVTSPTNHGNKISALMSDPDAMVADGWWQNRICTFARFIQGKDDDGNMFNPYGASVTPQDLKIRAFADATGQDLDDRVAAFAVDKIDDLYNKYETEIAEGAKVYETFTEGTPGIFGESGDDWNTDKPKDKRSPDELNKTLELAYQYGGVEQWVKELKSLSIDERTEVLELTYLPLGPARWAEGLKSFSDNELMSYLGSSAADPVNKARAIKQAFSHKPTMLEFIWKVAGEDEWLVEMRTYEPETLAAYLLDSRVTREQQHLAVHDRTIRDKLSGVEDDDIQMMLQTY